MLALNLSGCEGFCDADFCQSDRDNDVMSVGAIHFKLDPKRNMASFMVAGAAHCGILNMRSGFVLS